MSKNSFYRNGATGWTTKFNCNTDANLRYLPIIKTMDEAGFHALEMWGGATFDSCVRYLNEDPGNVFAKFAKKLKIPNFKCYYEDKIY